MPNGAMANEAIGTSYPHQDVSRESSDAAASSASSVKRERNELFAHVGFSPRDDCDISHRLAG